jgi:cytidyltransferase-like protein
MSTIGLLAGNFSPLHSGHFKLLEMAAENSDEVRVFVSLDGRGKKSQGALGGQQMAKIWEEIIEPFLMPNVFITYCQSESPIRKLYSFIGNSPAENQYEIYSDVDDAKRNYPDESIRKYFPDKIVNVVPIERRQTKQISGTQMRKFIEENNEQQFSENVPDLFDKKKYWKMARYV